MPQTEMTIHHFPRSDAINRELLKVTLIQKTKISRGVRAKQVIEKIFLNKELNSILVIYAFGDEDEVSLFFSGIRRHQRK